MAGVREREDIQRALTKPVLTSEEITRRFDAVYSHVRADLDLFRRMKLVARRLVKDRW